MQNFMVQINNRWYSRKCDKNIWKQICQSLNSQSSISFKMLRFVGLMIIKSDGQNPQSKWFLSAMGQLNDLD